MENKNLEQGLWAATATSPPVLSPLSGEKQTDVAIVGGGYTGLSAALHLANSGTDCIVLEGKKIGYGGAGRNVGLVNAGLWLMPSDVIKTLGPPYAENLITILGQSPDLVYNLIERYNIDCEAKRNGTLHCAHSASGFKALEQREAQWKARGAPVTLLSREETRYIYDKWL